MIDGLQDVLGAGVTSFDGGNIILGGDGNDTITGRGGDDIIDGDKWLNVRISVRAERRRHRAGDRVAQQHDDAGGAGLLRGDQSGPAARRPRNQDRGRRRGHGHRAVPGRQHQLLVLG